MECPECGVDLVCGCRSCESMRERDGEKLKPYESKMEWIDGELEMCGNCGFTLHADGWMDEEANQIIVYTGMPSLTSAFNALNGRMNKDDQ